MIVERKMNLILRIFCIFILFSPIFCEFVKIHLTVTFSDDDGARGYAFEGARIVFSCSLGRAVASGEIVTIQDADRPSSFNRSCYFARDNNRSCEFNIRSLGFGKYRCVLYHSRGKIESNAIEYREKLCSESTKCRECNLSVPFCRIRQSSWDNHFANANVIECLTEIDWKSSKLCFPSDKFIDCPKGGGSECENDDLDSRRRQSPLVQYKNIESCPDEILRVSYNGSPITHRQRITLDSGAPPFLMLKIPPHLSRSPLRNATIGIRYDAGRNMAPLLVEVKGGESNFSIDQLLRENVSDTYVFRIEAIYGGGANDPSPMASVRLVAFMTFINATAEIYLSDQNETKLIANCSLAGDLSPIESMVRKFSTYWLVNGRRFDQESRSFAKDEIDGAVCHVEIVYGYCDSNDSYIARGHESLSNAIRERDRILSETKRKEEKEKEKEMDSQNPDTGQSKPEKSKKDEKEEVSWLTTEAVGYIITGVIVGVLVLSAIGFVGVFVFRKFRNRAVRNKELDATYKLEDEVLDIADIRQTACEVIGSPESAATLLSSMGPPPSVDNAAKTTVTGCAHPEVPLLVASKIRLPNNEADGLHVSEMSDYYGRTILLAQNPTPQQMEKYLNAIWKKRIGTVVIATDTRKEDVVWNECFSADDGGQMTIGKFETYTDASLQSGGGSYQYSVRVTFSEKRRKHKRQITFILADASVAFSKYIEVIEMAADSQSKKAGPQLRGVMFQCPTGTRRSAALLASFIGRQMWLRHRNVNLIGLMRYVRRYRLGAFDGNEGVQDARIVVGVMQIIATRTEMGNVGGLKVESYERDVFDQRARRKELEEIGHSTRTATSEKGRGDKIEKSEKKMIEDTAQMPTVLKASAR